MGLDAGQRLGLYEIVAPLGAGGMGEVYRARDTKLGRDVALKVLPEEFFEDEERRIRFEREARTLASLNHPGIAAIYSFEETPGSSSSSSRHILVMELVEGETLADRIARGALPLRQVLGVGERIASALDAAHRKAIVHRDLKPGNVMVTASGVKLLDFGLAKMLRPKDAAEALTSAQTAAKDVTRDGVILGTPSYMAPEQLEGKDSDARTDIFAFGAVLFEMATGRKAFAGASQASLISVILLSDPPPISTLQPATPPALDRLVRTCLAKDPEQRWQSAGDVARELKWIAEESAAGAVVPAAGGGRRRRRETLAWAVAAAAIVLGALLATFPRRAPAPAELTRFAITPPSGQNFIGLIELSPDARRILLLLRDEGGKNSLAVRSLDSLDLRRLPGTEDARGGFWSPDGREIAYFSEGKLKRVALDGGPARTVSESGAAFCGAWSREGTILFEREFGDPLFAVPASGGAPRPVTVLDASAGEVAHSIPAFLPDGRHFVYLARNIDVEKSAIVLASLDSKDSRRLFPAQSNAVFAEPGYLLFGRDDAVLAWRFDPRTLQLLGEPAPALEHVHLGSEDCLLGLSAAGSRMVYLAWDLRRRLVWVDRKGREVGFLGETGGYADVRISPDGRKVAVAKRDPSHGRNLDVWVLDSSRGTGVRITSERSDEFDPAWFPDGARLVYVSDRYGFYDLFERPASGGPEKVLIRSKKDKLLPTLGPDGRHLLVSVPEKGNFARVVLSLSDPADSSKLSGDPRFSEEHSVISPDGRWTTFESRESGEREVYVQPFSGGPKRQVSVGGGQMPVWNRNGSELFYAARNGVLMSVSLHVSSGSAEPGEPQPLFLLQAGIDGELPWNRHPYDVSPDGQRFLVIRRAPGVESDGLVVVTNWTAVLGRAR